MVTKKPLFFWVFHRYRGLQLLLLVVIGVTVFFRVIPLELQKRIINRAISLKKMDLLFMYCGFYLGAVVLAGGLKYLINVLQGYLGEKLLYEIRSELYQHVLRLPLPLFRRTPPGMVITSLTSELNGVGDFLGSAIAVPVINVLTLLTFAGYLMYLNPLLALLSFAIYPLEIAMIPMLQNRLNRLNQERIDVARSLSNTIGEAVAGVREIQAHGGYPIERKKFEGFIATVFSLRQRMNIINYGIKFSNNFFQNLGPFILFLLGGYLAMTGRFDLGALVAFLSAYEKLYDPWKELMNYYQDFQDSRIRYKRVMDYFDAEPEYPLAPTDREPYKLRGRIEVKDLDYVAEGQVQLLGGISLHLEPGEQLALVGFSGSGKSTLALVLGQLYSYDKGHVLLDDKELKTLTKMDTSRNIGFVTQQPFIFDGTIRENLLYACTSLLATGGPGEKESLPDREQILHLVREVGLEEDILRFGLNAVVAEDRQESLAPLLIKLRERFQRQWRSDAADMVEFFDVTRFLYHRTIYGNIIFGDPEREEHELDNLPKNPVFLKLLMDTGLYEPLLDLGRKLLEQSVMLSKDLGQDLVLMEDIPIAPDQFEHYRELVRRMYGEQLNQLTGRDNELVLRLALQFIPAEHDIVALPVPLEEKILEVRHKFIEEIGGKDLLQCQFGEEGDIPAEIKAKTDKGETVDFSIYCPSQYLYTKSVLDNILFGRVQRDQPGATEKMQQLVVKLLEEEKLLDEVLDIGLDFQVGSKGDRLSGGQKQKVAIVRALLKKAPILILDEATASLDNTSQARIQHMLETDLKGKCTVVAVVHRLDTVAAYDRIAVLKAGRIVEMGQYDQLMAAKSIFYGLRQASAATLDAAG
ncbi:MAG: ABC transporter ATP-binding protein/permease [Deltaproteobacteria bacterium]|jgi:putative ABC transport system ATP-binding protein|nr:ABC transporter ATP-binding protein/permease [Deltaproteobacteria bacterium]MDH3800981.1 ABC transporter ATP-binding protein/permease [Deltaproteobacteria bacterium]MDH3897640.1 ABC transporter ATP-binding protein/permease [Deltaproteobacteria bacterium]MDH3929749.1 ABC transporter ATP-binding protein/permease [Deltaproteobacteria bacterium]MDH3952101.1 ABC transporter ATP-binding protein/permease [Deltaproteobacteria bacterium]